MPQTSLWLHGNSIPKYWVPLFLAWTSIPSQEHSTYFGPSIDSQEGYKKAM